MTKVYCLCGKTGSGKSTFGQKLGKEKNAVILNVDNLMHPLFENRLSREEFDAKLKICIDYLLIIAKQILDCHTSVILDFGFWKKRHRLKISDYFKNHEVEFFYLKINTNLQKERIISRNSQADRTYFFTEKMIDELNLLFEEPDPEEEGIRFNIIEINPTAG